MAKNKSSKSSKLPRSKRPRKLNYRNLQCTASESFHNKVRKLMLKRKAKNPKVKTISAFLRDLLEREVARA